MAGSSPFMGLMILARKFKLGLSSISLLKMDLKELVLSTSDKCMISNNSEYSFNRLVGIISLQINKKTD